jgi:hypothetical protein
MVIAPSTCGSWQASAIRGKSESGRLQVFVYLENREEPFMTGVRTNKRARKTIHQIRSAIGSGLATGVHKIRRISNRLSKRAPEQYPENLARRYSERPAKQRLFEEQVEARVKTLGDVVSELTAAPYVGLLMRQRDSIRETLVELVVKEEALREIVQMAKHSENGSAREMLWSDIEGALADLEKKAERFAKAACA